MTPTTISKAFGSLTDPRIDRTKRHPLINILTISICAIIAGCDDFQSISEFGKSKKIWFGEFLDLSHGIPSRDTFNDVLNRLNPHEFSALIKPGVLGYQLTHSSNSSGRLNCSYILPF
jgi:hypothetical protein